MQVTNRHLLDGVAYPGLSPNHGGALLNPTLLVLHYTASGGTGKDDATYLSSAAAKASAHVVIGRRGMNDITQIVPFNVKAWHAGVSIWRGRSNCNDYSIGIEIDNYGYVLKTADGKYHPGANSKAIIDPSLVMEGKHKNPGYSYKYWEVYPPEQITDLIEVINAILDKYPTIKEIVGHEDIAPGRKSDPGPALPWNHILAMTIGRTAKVSVPATVTASELNVRGGGGTEFPIIDALKRGDKVDILYDVPGAWAEISYTSAHDGQTKSGFVNDSYLQK